MKNLKIKSLKEPFKTVRGEFNSLQSRVGMNITPESARMMPESVFYALEASLTCLNRIDVDKLDEFAHRIKTFKSPLHRASKSIQDSFIDEVSAILVVDRSTCVGLKALRPMEDMINEKCDLLDGTEYLDGMPTVRRKSLLISSTSMVAKNKLGNYTVVPHIQIAIWDGYLDSPNGWIIYLTKCIDKYKFVFIQKKAKSENMFNLDVYDLDLSCNVLSKHTYQDMSTEKDILNYVSLHSESLYDHKSAIQKVVDQYNLIKIEEAIENEIEKQQVKRERKIKRGTTQKIAR